MKIKNLFFLTVIILLLSAWSYYAFDITALNWVNAHPYAWISIYASVVQHAFTFTIWSWLAPLAIIIIWWRAGSLKQALGRRSMQVFLGFLIAMLICFILKTSLGRYRPQLFLTQHLYGFSGGFTMNYLRASMPSDHSALIFSLIASLAMISRSRFFIFILCIVGLFSVAMRVYMLKHYPSDVGVGIVVGLWASYLAYVICERFR
jgi:membrane-associated phospholipid phosphatase